MYEIWVFRWTFWRGWSRSVSGQPVCDHFLKERIFDPLGMVDTGLRGGPSQEGSFGQGFYEHGKKKRRASTGRESFEFEVSDGGVKKICRGWIRPVFNDRRLPGRFGQMLLLMAGELNGVSHLEPKSLRANDRRIIWAGLAQLRIGLFTEGYGFRTRGLPFVIKQWSGGYPWEHSVPSAGAAN